MRTTESREHWIRRAASLLGLILLAAGDVSADSKVTVQSQDRNTTSQHIPVPCSIIEPVSVNSMGILAQSASAGPLNENGRFVLFTSGSDNVVPDEGNGTNDVFLHDRITGVTQRISVDSTGIEGNGQSISNDLSSTGRYVVFTSEASNFAADDTNGASDMFVHDRVSKVTELVSVNSSGKAGNRGTYTNTQGNGAVSADGRFVAFSSGASDLVAGDTNNKNDVFVRDRMEGTTERISVGSTGIQGNFSSYSLGGLSHDGRFVAYGSAANNLVSGITVLATHNFYLHDRHTHTTSLLTVNTDGVPVNQGPTDFGFSGDGRFAPSSSGPPQID